MKLDKAETLKKLGSSSSPFSAKFGGVCPLSGLKIKTGDEVAFYGTGTSSPCHVEAIVLHAWFPWTGKLSPEKAIPLLQKIEKNREKKGKVK
jgi:hypothetical protein